MPSAPGSSRPTVRLGAVVGVVALAALLFAGVPLALDGGETAGADPNAAVGTGHASHADHSSPTDHGYTGKNVTVAVLDTGIDDSHPDLEGQVVDRVDFTADEADRHPDSGTDNHGHGTHVAGVVGGTGAADDDRAGVAPNVDLVDVRILDDSGDWDADEEIVAEGITYAVEEADADIILLSLNNIGPEPEVIADSVTRATDAGVLVVASAGNRGEPRSITTPGTTPGTLTVGATDGAGRVLDVSSRGPTLDGGFKPELVAPGERIAGPRAGYTDGDSNPYVHRTGTSLAAANAAGAAALLVEAEPTLTPREVKNRLTSTARPLDDAHAYGAGSGELDVTRALEPDVVSDGTIDFGVVSEDTTTTRTVTFENRGDRPRDLSFEATVENVDTGERADETVTLNRSELLLAPDETATVELTVDGNTTSGAHAGEIRYDVDGEPHSVAVGFVRGGTVTVEKRPLSAGDRVDGNELLVFTEEGTHSELLEFENGTATFTGGGGTYVLWSAGVDEPTGSLVLLSERIRVTGDEHVILDESETIRAGIAAGPLVERYGPLENRSVTASMTTRKGDGFERLSRSQINAANRTVRVSPDPKTSVATTYLLTTDSGDSDLDAADIFHLGNRVQGAQWASPATIRPADLETTEYRLHRTTVDRTPQSQERAAVVGPWNSRQLSWFDLGDRTVQRVHRSPGLSYERHLRGDGWRAVLEGSEPLSHPFFAGVTEYSTADGTASVEVRPLDDGDGTRIHAGGKHTVSAIVDGELRDRQRGSDPVLSMNDINVTAEEAVTVRIEGDNRAGRLSTTTLTELTVPPHEPGAPPALPLLENITIEGATPTNAAGPGAVSVSISVENWRSVSEPTVWYAAGAPEAPPWEDTTGWQRAPTGFGYKSVAATLDVPDDAETVSLAAELRTENGSEVRTMTTDAFHVGSAPNTSTRLIEGQLRAGDGTIADNDTVVATPADGGDPFVTRTDREGRFELEVPREVHYGLEYRRGKPWTHNASVAPSRPLFYALGDVHVTDEDVSLEETVPSAARLDVGVVDERGVPVENATVRLTQRSGNATTGLTLALNEEGYVTFDGRQGVAVASDIEIAVEPPDEAAVVGETVTRNVTVDGNHTAAFVLETVPPTAAVSTSRTWMLEGTPTTLDASESDVPAGPAEYRWDLNGDGKTDRVTEKPRLRYSPEVGVSEPSVTVVDAAGKTDSASIDRITVTERD